LFTFERLVENGIATNIKNVILITFHYNGGLIDEKIVKRVVLSGADGISMFQGVKFGLIILLRTQ
jgi:hypothetical protein